MNYQIMIDLCMLLLLIVLTVRLEKKQEMHSVSKKEALGILILTLIVTAAITLMMEIGQLLGLTNVSDYSNQIKETLATNISMDSARLIFVIIILTPIIEEYIFRYLVFKVLDKIKNIPYKEAFNIICGSVLFGSLHGIGPQRVYGFVCGIILGLLYYYSVDWTNRRLVKDKNLTRPILFHMTFNAIGYLSYIILEIL